MAVVDLRRKAIERLGRQLIPDLAAAGMVTAEVTDLDNVIRWRMAARVAGRHLGYPIRTTLSGDGATVRHPDAAHTVR